MKNIKGAIAFKLGFIYVSLTLVNLAILSFSVIDSQTEFILDSFRAKVNNLANEIRLDSIQVEDFTKLRQKKSSGAKDLHSKLKKLLNEYELDWLQVYNPKAELLFQLKSQEDLKIKKIDVTEKIKQKEAENVLDDLRVSSYLSTLYKEDFSADMLFPISKGSEQTYLLIYLRIEDMQEKLNAVYWQAFWLTLAAIILHILAGSLIGMAIIRRVAMLAKISQKLQKGMLESRAAWKKLRKHAKRKKKWALPGYYDELDFLGFTFNNMAHSIQKKIETISNLNLQIQRELEMGKDVQNLLIQRPKEIMKSFSPVVYSRPLREVSGDMLYYFPYKDDTGAEYKVVFFADASGHGVPAALVTAVSFLSLENAIKSCKKKEDLMVAVNDIIALRMQQSYYLTAVFMFIGKNNRVHLVNAGHNTFFISKRNGKRIAVESSGMPIGIVEGAEYDTVEYQLEQGDKILAYTDGLPETQDEHGNEFGVSRIEEILDETASLASKDLGNKLHKEFKNFAKKYIDDVSFIILQMNE